MSIPENFRHIFVWTEIWQFTGYSAILYIASLSAIPPERYEAAYMDGASRIQRILYIDIPALIIILQFYSSSVRSFVNAEVFIRPR